MTEINYDPGAAPVRPIWMNEETAPYRVVKPTPVPARRKASVPAWAIVAIVVGAVVFAVCIGLVVGSFLVGLKPERATEMEVTGECRNRIIGSYGLVATVTVHNPTDQPVTGDVWATWQVLGGSPYEFSKPVTIAPGGLAHLYVDEEVDTDTWYQLEECEYGWTPTTD